MARDDQKTVADRIPIVDARILSPAKRCELIYAKLREFLPDATDWDLICFASEYLGLMAATKFTWLQVPVRRVSFYVYNAHYLATEEMGLWPSQGTPSGENGKSTSATPTSQSEKTNGQVPPTGEGEGPKRLI